MPNKSLSNIYQEMRNTMLENQRNPKLNYCYPQPRGPKPMLTRSPFVNLMLIEDWERTGYNGIFYKGRWGHVTRGSMLVTAVSDGSFINVMSGDACTIQDRIDFDTLYPKLRVIHHKSGRAVIIDRNWFR